MVANGLGLPPELLETSCVILGRLGLMSLKSDREIVATNRQGFVSRGAEKSLAKQIDIGIDDPDAPRRKKVWKALHLLDMRGRIDRP